MGFVISGGNGGIGETEKKEIAADVEKTVLAALDAGLSATVDDNGDITFSVQTETT